jgi:hypothetical protein
MQTEEFRDALAALIRISRENRVAIMCAEAVPWRCHRSLVADALVVRGVPVVEILSGSSYRMHELTPFAQVEGARHPPSATLLWDRAPCNPPRSRGTARATRRGRRADAALVISAVTSGQSRRRRSSPRGCRPG